MKKMVKNGLKNFDMVLMGFLLLNIFVWMSVNVFCRFVLRNSLSWSDEYCRVCFIWMTMIAFEYNVRKRNNISMTLVFRNFPRVVQLVITCITNILAAAAIAAFLPSTIKLAQMHQTVFTPALHMPRIYITGLALICFAATIIMLILDDVKLVREYIQEAKQ